MAPVIVVVLRAMSPDTHPARVGLNLAFTSKIGAEVMMAQFLDLVPRRSVCFYYCSLRGGGEGKYTVLSCHGRQLF